MIKSTDSQSDASMGIKAIVNAEGERFLFDQNAQHSLLWEAVRDRNWIALDSLIDEKV